MPYAVALLQVNGGGGAQKAVAGVVDREERCDGKFGDGDVDGPVIGVMDGNLRAPHRQCLAKRDQQVWFDVDV